MAKTLSASVTGRVDLLVGIDTKTYADTKKALESLFDKQVEIGIDLGSVKDLADKFREASRLGGTDVGDALSKRFDTEVGHLLADFEVVRAQVLAAVEAGDMASYAKFANDQAVLEAQIDAEMKAHKNRLDAAKKFQEATSFNFKNLRESGVAVEQGFTDALNKVRAGDLAGFTESVAGSLSKYLGKKATEKSLAAASAGDEGAAAGLAEAAASLGVAAAALAAAAAVIGVAVAAFVMLDDAAKDLNKTLLEGASIADFSSQSQMSSLRDVEGSMLAARRASIDMATDFRGTGEEMAGILGQLNAAGFTYREIEDGVTSVADKQAKYTKAIEDTFVWSKALGVSTSEIADTTAEWSTEFGLGLEDISDNFAKISGYAMQGGFNVKRFFTAVSQATSGMAIYNTRMDEAAYLLSKTQKILGGTDASDFVKSLTQGFTDESTTDRLKRIMIAGAKDTQQIFEDSAARTSEAFVEAFKDGKTRKDLEGAFQKLDKNFDVSVLNDPKKFQKSWGKMDAKSRRIVIAQLRENGDEQAQAAARQLETLGRLTDGTSKGQAAQVRGLGALDMQGKLSYKLQTLGDKRLNDMSTEELAAFESYAGISGSQLEQLMRVESQLMADYELAKTNGTTTAKSFQEFVSSSKDAQKKIADVGEVTDEAKYFAQQNVENTRSVFSVLKNTIASILEDTYDLLSAWFGATNKLSAESQGKIASALTEIGDSRKESIARLDDIEGKLSDADKIIKTTGADAPEHVKAEADKAQLEDQQKKEKAAQEYLRAQERHVRLLDETSIAATSDVLGLVQERMSKSGEDVDIAAKYLTKDVLSDVVDAKKQSSTFDMNVKAGDQTALMSYAPKGSDTVVSDMLLKSTGDMSTSLADGNQLVSKYAFSGGKGMADIAADDKKLLESYVKSFPGDVTDAVADGTRKANAEKLASGLEYVPGTADYDKVVSDVMSSNFAPYKKAIDLMGLAPQVQTDFGVDVGKIHPEKANDFVMRPGQPAQRFNPSDTILGMKGGGPLVTGQGGTGGTVNITINGGDQAAVYRTVKDALKNSGLRP